MESWFFSCSFTLYSKSKDYSIHWKSLIKLIIFDALTKQSCEKLEWLSYSLPLNYFVKSYPLTKVLKTQNALKKTMLFYKWPIAFSLDKEGAHTL